MRKTKVLFICVQNSARSQMAEAYLKKIGGDRFEVMSAGLKPGKLNQTVVKILQEDGINIACNTVDDVFELIKKELHFHYVITVCSEAEAEGCPFFPDRTVRMHWDVEDPSKFEGSEEKKLENTRKIRDEIKKRVQEFIKEAI